MQNDLKNRLDLYIAKNYVAEVAAEKCCRSSKPFFMRASASAAVGMAPVKLEDVIDRVGMTFGECLFGFIDKKNMTNAEVYKKAGIDRKLFSKIQCDKKYNPSKKTALALALALELDLDQTKDLLARAGHALSPSSVFDLIVQFFIENSVYDILTINDALYEYGEPTFGE